MILTKISKTSLLFALLLSCSCVTSTLAFWAQPKAHHHDLEATGSRRNQSSGGGGGRGKSNKRHDHHQHRLIKPIQKEYSFKKEKDSFEGEQDDNLKYVLGLIATVLVGIGTFSAGSLTNTKPKKKKTLNKATNYSSSGSLVSQAEFCVVDNEGFDKATKRINGVDFAFEGIQLTLTTTKKKVKKTNNNNKDCVTAAEEPTANRLLLDGSFKGRARPGRMLAIMGPSGAGKSVLLHALCGRIKADRNLTLRGERYLDGELQAPDSLIPAAFVEQEVNFFPRMTVRETLEFRVALHFGDLLDEEDRDELVMDLLLQLGLNICADTIVGDNKVRGISIGERKRLSIAVEMISSPRLVCCDEPTSSLDSAAAAVVIEKLRKLAVKGKTVICVIHQPSSMIFSQFDDVLLVSEGKQLYFGPVSKVRQYMEKQGYLADEETGTAEHALDCVSPLPTIWESPEEAQRRVKALAIAAADQSEKIDLGIGYIDPSCPSLCRSVGGDSGIGPRTSMWTQFTLLLHRAVSETFRGKDVIMIKTMQQIVVASIYGGIYSLGNNQASILDRFGLLSLTSIGGTNMAIATTLRAFPKEKSIASTEIAIKQYRALPYFVAKAVSEFPLVFYYNMVMGTILFFATGMNPGRFWTFVGLLTLHSLASEASGMAVGAVSPSSDVALAIFPAILILNIIFDGRNISAENTPWGLGWVSKVSLIRWGYEGLVVNEFEGLTFVNATDNHSGPVARNGDEALAHFGMENASIEEVVHAEAIIMVICWVLAYLGLTLTKQRFVPMTPRVVSPWTKKD